MYNLNIDNGVLVLVFRIMGFVGSKRKFFYCFWKKMEEVFFNNLCYMFKILLL